MRQGSFVEARLDELKQLVKDIKQREERLLYLYGKPNRTKKEQAELDKAIADYYSDDDYDY